MNCLVIDTTGPDCAVGVFKGSNDAPVILSDTIGRGHAEHLAPMVKTALRTAHILPSDIERIAVCIGPGSFTGLRVGLSFAKGFALAHDRPLLGLDRLTLARADNPDALIILDIKRGDYAVSVPKNGNTIVNGADELEALIAAYEGECIKDPAINMKTLGRLCTRLNPDEFPPIAFYGRAPDAKLKGGRSLADRQHD